MNREQARFLNQLMNQGVHLYLIMLTDPVELCATDKKNGLFIKIPDEKAGPGLVEIMIEQIPSISVHVATISGLRPLYYHGKLCLISNGLSFYYYADFSCHTPEIGSIIAKTYSGLSHLRRVFKIIPIIDFVDPSHLTDEYLNTLLEIIEPNVNAIKIHKEDNEPLAAYLDGGILNYFNGSSKMAYEVVKIIQLKSNK